MQLKVGWSYRRSEADCPFRADHVEREQRRYPKLRKTWPMPMKTARSEGPGEGALRSYHRQTGTGGEVPCQRARVLTQKPTFESEVKHGC